MTIIGCKNKASPAFLVFDHKILNEYKFAEVSENIEQESYFSVQQNDLSGTIVAENLALALNENVVDVQKSVHSGSLSPPTPGLCRICLQPDADDLNKCISPCLCCGSISKVHKSCLERWLAQADSSSCEICKYEFKTERLSTHSLLGSIGAWFCSSETQEDAKQFLYDLWLFFIITPAISLVSYAGLVINEAIFTDNTAIYNGTICRLLSFTALTILLTVDFLYGCWTSIRVQYHFGQWYNYYRRCQRVIIVETNQ
ncbi:E3 ubiquitin-protein ligase MARCHF3-like [Adelges cooleyi]|uniref:E3 ubiquitin-protein ligase MARCHF3-like n=1 Tax=Adelges cooleyi TaxID=133065 RepID=UPI00218003E3|nr:E3 ubiquitin-protein ligase MARCHF3-like [Adelges cooleyi]